MSPLSLTPHPMSHSSYPRPPPFVLPPYPTRTLLPIHPPPYPLTPPALPSPPRRPAFDAPYTLSTHLVPAAYLRTTPVVPVPAPPPAGAGKEERRRRILEMRDELNKLRESMEEREGGHACVLWNCVNRYVRKGLGADGKTEGTGVTLFFAHANGFPKETWEPTLSHLLISPAAPLIDEIWTWESIQHGDAALINKDNLSGVFDWHDNTRDILNFLLHFLPSRVTSTTLPTHLPLVPVHETEARRGPSGWGKHRTIVGVGHSFGGCTTTLAAITHPALFSALVLVDPIIIKPPTPEQPVPTEYKALTLGALSRRESWESQKAALVQMTQTPFFLAWDPAALALYVQCGTHVTADGAARLKMPGIQEAIVFSETYSELEVYTLLPALPEEVALRWIMPGREGATEFGPPGAAQERVWLRPTNASNIRISKAGHLIPQEAPLELANELHDFLLRRYSDGENVLEAPLHARL